jgi:hypothetical protein
MLLAILSRFSSVVIKTSEAMDSTCKIVVERKDSDGSGRTREEGMENI